MDVPELTDSLVDKIAGQSDIQADGADLRQLERCRDDGLVAILRALKPNGIGAGALLAEQTCIHANPPPDPGAAAPLRLHTARVPSNWIDYNGHMTEHRYLQVFGDAADALFAALGVDAAYLAGGHSYFTAESHLRHLAEVDAGAVLHITTQILGHDAKRLHVFHQLWRTDDDRLLATAEQMYLHVDTAAGRTCPAAAPILAHLAAAADAQANLETPDGVGRVMGVAPKPPRPISVAPIGAASHEAPVADFCTYPVTHAIAAAGFTPCGCATTVPVPPASTQRPWNRSSISQPRTTILRRRRSGLTTPAR